MLLSVQKQMFDLLEGWLRHKSNMVNFEAARAICEARNVTAAQATKAISGTVRFLALFWIRPLKRLCRG
jgi:coatomer protein complex subunit gamma